MSSVGVDAGRGESGARGGGGVVSARNRARGVSFSGARTIGVVIESISDMEAKGLVVAFNGVSKQMVRRPKYVSYAFTHIGNDPDRTDIWIPRRKRNAKARSEEKEARFGSSFAAKSLKQCRGRSEFAPDSLAQETIIKLYNTPRLFLILIQTTR